MSVSVYLCVFGPPFRAGRLREQLNVALMGKKVPEKGQVIHFTLVSVCKLLLNIRLFVFFIVSLLTLFTLSDSKVAKRGKHFACKALG